MKSCFIYWDNSNIFHAAQYLAEDREATPAARFRIRIHFESLYRLAHADRKVERAYAAGSIPPQLQSLWNRLENQGVDVELFDRVQAEYGEQGVPDQFLQLKMLEDAFDFNGDPGTVVLLSGDGAGYREGRGFHSTLERMRGRGWRVEVLSWTHSCKLRMRQWAETNGVFVPLEDFYQSITFVQESEPGYQHVGYRPNEPLDLSNRPLAV